MQHEYETGECFDWVVRSRTDHEWKTVAPPIVTLPRDAVTTSSMWPWLRSSSILARPRALEDHLMVVPRPAAALAMNVVAVWNDCRSVDDLPFSGPPAQHHPCPGRLPDGTPFLSSECLLGMYVYEHLRLNGSQMRWMSDSRFDMQPRPAPGELHAAGMVMEVNYIPGRWNVTATGARQRVAFEGGKPVANVIRKLTELGIPVMGHLGLTPQSVHQMGGYMVQARTFDQAKNLIEDAQILQESGAFAVVLEAVPSELAKLVTERLSIPTIGIGAGNYCDGQIQVINDILGFSSHSPRHSKQYADINAVVLNALNVFLLLILILGVLLLLLALFYVLGLVVSAIVVGFEADLLDSAS